MNSPSLVRARAGERQIVSHPAQMSRIIVATVIAVALFGVYLSQSGAPTRVHVATALSLLVGFYIPALRIDSLRKYREQWRWVALWTLAGGSVWSILGSIVVAKAEIWDSWYIIPVAAVGFAVLLSLHAAISGAFSRGLPVG